MFILGLFTEGFWSSKSLLSVSSGNFHYFTYHHHLFVFCKSNFHFSASFCHFFCAFQQSSSGILSLFMHTFITQSPLEISLTFLNESNIWLLIIVMVHRFLPRLLLLDMVASLEALVVYHFLIDKLLPLLHCVLSLVDAVIVRTR